MAGDLDRKKNKHTPCRYFRCGYVDNLISKCSKPPKDNQKKRKTVRFNERGNCAPQKESDNGDDDNDQTIYVSMA